MSSNDWFLSCNTCLTDPQHSFIPAHGTDFNFMSQHQDPALDVQIYCRPMKSGTQGSDAARMVGPQLCNLCRPDAEFRRMQTETFRHVLFSFILRFLVTQSEPRPERWHMQNEVKEAMEVS
jgi:hypothetical protein